ncbi:MAG: T9SS type A sorting domain-containing protein [Candidatus Eisenbacteria bacterium]
MLVWRDYTNPTVPHRDWLITADASDSGVTAPDSIATVDQLSEVQAGAQHGVRRWVATTDASEGPGPADYFTVLYTRGSEPRWSRLPVPELNEPRADSFCQLLATSDTTALAVYTTVRNLAWGIVNDTGWVHPPEHLAGGFPDDAVHLRRNPDGSVFLRYGTHDSITFMRRFDGTHWSAEDTLRWLFPPETRPFEYLTYVGPMTLDDRPLPALLGAAYSDRNAILHTYVNIPTDQGYGRFEMVPGTEELFPIAIARDDDGDVWIAWWTFFDGMFWSHTYTSVNCSTPTLGDSGGRPQLRWTLSEPAPGSYWSVLRALNGGGEQVVARVAGGVATEMSWSDTSLPSGARATYRIRRECVDVRYRLLSESSAEWVPRSQALAVSMLSPNPLKAEVRLQVEGAGSGWLSLTAYDLQGRVVLRDRVRASGTGRDAASLPIPSSLRGGLYLLRVTAEGGGSSTAKKLVVLR